MLWLNHKEKRVECARWLICKVNVEMQQEASGLNRQVEWRFVAATSGCRRQSSELKPAMYILNIVWRQRSSLWDSHANVPSKGHYYEISVTASLGNLFCSSSTHL